MLNWKLTCPPGAPFWFVEWTDASGCRHIAPTGCSDPAAAAAVGASIAQSQAHPSHPPAHQTSGGHSLNEALDRFIDAGLLDNPAGTVQCYVQRSGHLCRLLGETDVNFLTLDLVQDYIRQRLSEGAARETVRKELTVLRQTLKLAGQRGLFYRDPSVVMPRFEVRSVPRVTWITPEQFELLLAEFAANRQLWLLLAVYAGARLSEVEGLHWADVDLAQRELRLRGSKTAGSFRIVLLHTRLEAALKAVTLRGDGPVVETWGNVRRDLAAACKRVGVVRVTPNDLRRTFSSWLVQRGVSNFTVSRLLGHSTTKMVDRVYGHLSKQALREAIDKLPAPWQEGSTDGSLLN